MAPLDHPTIAQFVFYRNYVEIHWSDATSEEEMNRYLKAICKRTGLMVYDPQNEKVYRLDRHGEFK